MNTSSNYGTSFEDLLGDRLRTLATFVHQLEESITARHELSRQFLEWIADEYTTTKGKLLFLYAWPFPSNPAVEQRRNTLTHSLETLLAEERQEEVQCWRDTELLNKELRHWQKQHEDLAQRLALLQGSLG